VALICWVLKANANTENQTAMPSLESDGAKETSLRASLTIVCIEFFMAFSPFP